MQHLGTWIYYFLISSKYVGGFGFCVNNVLLCIKLNLCGLFGFPLGHLDRLYMSICFLTEQNQTRRENQIKPSIN